MYKLNIQILDRQADALKSVTRQTNLGLAEFVRRCLDHCLQERVLNQLVPALSGQLQLQNR